MALLDYNHQNLVRRGYVDEPDDWEIFKRQELD